MGAILLAVIFMSVLFASANNINEQCQVHNGSRITCSCIGNEEFFLPDEYNYVNITGVSIANCDSAFLHYSSLPEAKHLEELVVQNISGRLDFSPFIASSRMKLLRLSNIGRIPVIRNHTFVTLTSIDTFELENVRIEEVEEDFTYIHVSRFVVTNVTIERMDRLNLSENGTMRLLIRNSEFRSIATSLNFVNFKSIDIIDSRFVLQKPGLVSVQGNIVVVMDSVFSNASMNLVAEDVIRVRGICADGKSTLRLSANSIESIGNRLPNGIAYPARDSQHVQTEFFVDRNNTVCKAGNCKCSPRSSGQAPCRECVSMLVLHCLLMITLLVGLR